MYFNKEYIVLGSDPSSFNCIVFGYWNPDITVNKKKNKNELEMAFNNFILSGLLPLGLTKLKIIDLYLFDPEMPVIFYFRKNENSKYKLNDVISEVDVHKIELKTSQLRDNGLIIHYESPKIILGYAGGLEFFYLGMEDNIDVNLKYIKKYYYDEDLDLELYETEGPTIINFTKPQIDP